MHLHRVLGQPQRVGDLLVEQAIGQAQQHAELLRGQLGQAAGQQRVGLGALGGHRREPQAAVEHGLHRLADGLGRGRLRDETGRAELLRAADHPRMVIGREDHHRNVRMRAASSSTRSTSGCASRASARASALATSRTCASGRLCRNDCTTAERSSGWSSAIRMVYSLMPPLYGQAAASAPCRLYAAAPRVEELAALERIQVHQQARAELDRTAAAARRVIAARIAGHDRHQPRLARQYLLAARRQQSSGSTMASGAPASMRACA
ncbi:hypothetical protein G6F35_013292 [Rhizopus arrhizus]|nr:hypothetical protein G6F35_013292 [Rhizopus arrhizus]